MSFFNSVYNTLFKKSSTNGVISREPLKRSEKYTQKFQEWYNTSACEVLLKKVHKAYHLKRTDIDDLIPVLLFRSEYANGFAIRNNDVIKDEEFHLLLDFFRHQLIKIGYRQAGSDSKLTSKQHFVLGVDKFYMKPPIQVEPPIDQLYGNVSIELHLLDDKPSHLKLMASIYSDRLYKKHKDFDELVEHLFSLS